MKTIYLRCQDSITTTIGKQIKEVTPVIAIEEFLEHWAAGYCLCAGRYIDGESLTPLPDGAIQYKITEEQINAIALMSNLPPQLSETERRRLLLIAGTKAILDQHDDYGMKGSDYEEWEPEAIATPT